MNEIFTTDIDGIKCYLNPIPGMKPPWLPCRDVFGHPYNTVSGITEPIPETNHTITKIQLSDSMIAFVSYYRKADGGKLMTDRFGIQVYQSNSYFIYEFEFIREDDELVWYAYSNPYTHAGRISYILFKL